MSDVVQDEEVNEPGPRVRVRVALALLRILAGPRGWSLFRWSGAGFVYELHVTRASEVPTLLHYDPDGIGAEDARTRLLGEFTP